QDGRRGPPRLRPRGVRERLAAEVRRRGLRDPRRRPPAPGRARPGQLVAQRLVVLTTSEARARLAPPTLPEVADGRVLPAGDRLRLARYARALLGRGPALRRRAAAS